MTCKTTTELKRGDRIGLFNGLIRTVERTHHSGYDNRRGEPIWCVRYQEPPSEGLVGRQFMARPTRPGPVDADGNYRPTDHPTDRS